MLGMSEERQPLISRPVMGLAIGAFLGAALLAGGSGSWQGIPVAGILGGLIGLVVGTVVAIVKRRNGAKRQ